MIFIPISVALLALTSGMLLLAKTRKENLGKFFKVISYFIIISSFLIMGLTIIGGFTRMLLRKMDHNGNSECTMHIQNRKPWMKEEFMHHEDLRGMERWHENRLQNENETDTLENHKHRQRSEEPEVK